MLYLNVLAVHDGDHIMLFPSITVQMKLIQSAVLGHVSHFPETNRRETGFSCVENTGSIVHPFMDGEEPPL